MIKLDETNYEKNCDDCFECINLFVMLPKMDKEPINNDKIITHRLHKLLSNIVKNWRRFLLFLMSLFLL